MSVHLQPVSFTARVYAPGGSYEAGSDYVASCQVLLLGGVAIVYAAAGALTRAHLRELAAQIRTAGARWVLAQRAGAHRLPGGVRVEAGPWAGWWQLDLAQVGAV